MSKIQAPAEVIVMAKARSALRASTESIRGAPSAKVDDLSKLGYIKGKITAADIFRLDTIKRLEK